MQARAPLDHSTELSIASLEASIKEMQGNLQVQKERRGKEVIELRFRGSLADFGSLPLHLVGEIASDLYGALGHTARMRKVGTQGRVLKEISSTLDLRLDGIAAGSTKLYITGETAPDLFGRSLLEETLRDAFSFFKSPTADDLTDAVGQVGTTVAGHYRDLLKAIGKNRLAFEITWDSPREEEMTWSASAMDARRIAIMLSKLIPDEPITLHVVGEIITVSERRPLEIRDADGVEYVIRIPDRMSNDLKGFSLQQKVAVAIESLTIRNQITGRDKTTLMLKTIAAV